MKRNLVFRLFILCLIAMLLPFASCTNVEQGDDPSSTIEPTLPEPIHEEYPEYEGNNGKTITLAATNANGVNGYAVGSTYVMENLNTKIIYNLSANTDNGFTGVQSIENLSGGVYIKNTMDSYVETTSGKTYYSGGSSGRFNLYDQGYYLYNVHILDQSFTSLADEDTYEKKYQFDLSNFTYASMAENPVTKDGITTLVVKDPADPYWVWTVPGKPKVSDYNAFLITLKTPNTTNSQIFYTCGSMGSFDGEHILKFTTIADNEFHTYLVLFEINKMSGAITSVRLDCGVKAGEVVQVKDFSIVKSQNDIPTVRLDRNFNVYSDKINENVRYLAFEKTELIYSIGTITKIEKSNVEKYVITDAAGNHYDTLQGVDMSTVMYAAFDIKDVGIFGYILENDPSSGTLSITEDGDYYILNQNLLYNKTLKSGDDIYLTRRIYTDTNHTFDNFLKEAYEERNPLTDVTINSTNKKIKFVGYDVYNGAYNFKLTGSTNGFDDSYYNALKEHNVSFTINGEASDRKIYIRGNTPTNDGTLECAVVLDEYSQLMPIKVEVCKNFANDGEELFYTNNDTPGYGYSTFPMVVESNKTNTLDLCHLYEQWGNYRLKQISSIRFHIAYYHISLGVTETNCIVLYNPTTRLPDHRGLSTLYWADEMIDIVDANGDKTGQRRCYGQQPQHTNEGTHEFLQYTDKDGNYSSYENCGNTTIASSGPTLADITLNYISSDGKVLQSYRHVEMPQTDENRTYYELDYEFLADVTVNDVMNDLSLYKVSANYLKFGYLNDKNECIITDANKSGKTVYKLGSESPYFDYFMKKDNTPNAKVEEDVYCNLSFFLVDSDITIGGKAYNGDFVVVEGNGSAQFTLDISGKTTFKKGDHIKLFIILMPWGGEFSENDDNVRMVRINTLLNPIKLDVASGKQEEDAIVPTVKAENGKSCEFTVKGGYNNVRDLPSYASSEYTKYKASWMRDYNITLKITGLTNLSKPKIMEKVGNEWVEYVYSSTLGYDGYTVEYCSDGTFTYTFVITMTEGTPRTFSFEA